MKLLSKINTATKIVILVVYTFILAAIAVLIINASTVVNEAEGYGSKAMDENIQVVTKIKETRTHSTDSSNPNAYYGLYFQVIQRATDVEITNIEIFAKGRTHKGGTIYFEESKASDSSYSGLPSKTSTAFKSFTSNFKKTINTKNEVTDTELERLFVRILYSVKKDEATTQKELKFYYSLFDQYKQKYDNFDENIIITDVNQFMSISNDEIGYYNGQMKVNYNEDKTAVDTKVSFDESKFIENNKYVTDCSFTVIGKVKHDNKDTQNIFSDYMKLLELHGVPVNMSGNNFYTESQKKNLSSFYESYNPINTLYDLSELYLFVSITNNEGKTTYHNVKIAMPSK